MNKLIAICGVVLIVLGTSSCIIVDHGHHRKGNPAQVIVIKEKKVKKEYKQDNGKHKGHHKKH